LFIVPVDLDSLTGTPIVPEDIKQRVRNGERIAIEILPQVNGFAKNALRWGVAGLNVDGGRIPFDGGSVGVWGAKQNTQCGSGGTMGDGWAGTPSTQSPAGRWPSNLILDESAAAALDEASGVLGDNWRRDKSNKSVEVNGYDGGWRPTKERNNYASDTGGASRFFYVAKASRRERNAGLDGMEAQFAPKGNYEGRDMDNPRNHLGGLQGSTQQNHHPTVKPLALMQYLVRLTATPFGGVVLDPFMGSGTTGVAALMEGRSFVGIEREPEYLEIARRRIDAATLPLMREAAD
jgi:hypothetical protein